MMYRETENQKLCKYFNFRQKSTIYWTVIFA